MKRLSIGLLFLSFIFSSFLASAQNVSQAKQFIYYERFQSAKNVLNQILASTPNNEEAAYLYGQAEIGLENIPAAHNWYVQKLQASPNSALLTAGLGHVLILQGKNAEARNKFETAISLSEGKNISVLNAVGYANSNPEIKNGDARYAIDVLTKATNIKGFKDPEVLTNLGDAYRKTGDGGNAILSYEAALKINPNYAKALFRKGRVYQSQGVAQEALFNKLYEEGMAKDPAYAPIYLNQFNYYYTTNVPRAADYLDKWLLNSDDDPKACYYRASMKFAQGLFNDAITASDNCIKAEGANAYPNLYGLKALSFMKLKDTVSAKSNYQTFFQKQDADKIGAGDYATYGLLLMGTPDADSLVKLYTDKAVEFETVEANKVNYLKNVALAYEQRGNNLEAANWYAKILKVKTNYSNVDIFNAGYNFYLVNEMDSAVVYFKDYAEKYPDDIMGHYMLGNANAIIDSTGELGLAVPHYLKTIEIAEADTTKPNAKSRLLNAYRFFIGYHYNTKKDQKTALEYIDKALAIAPTDEQLKSFKEIVSKHDPKKPGR